MSSVIFEAIEIVNNVLDISILNKAYNYFKLKDRKLRLFNDFYGDLFIVSNFSS